MVTEGLVLLAAWAQLGLWAVVLIVVVLRRTPR